MTTFNTGNPVGSSDPRDLYDNAENADNLINGDQAAYNDRLGQSRKSWTGVEQQVAQQAAEFEADQASRETTFANFLNSSGFEYLGEYASGLTFTEYNQYVVSAGEAWFISPSTALPYTTTGAGLPEGGALMSRGEAVLRQEIGSGVRRVDSLAGLQAISGRFSGDVAYMVGRTSAGDGGEGEFRWDGSDLSALVSTDTQQGIYVAPASDPTGAGGAWIRQSVDDLTPEMFGAIGDDSAVDTDALNAFIVFGGVSLPPNKTYLTGAITVSSDLVLNGNGSTIKQLASGGSTAFSCSSGASLKISNITFIGSNTVPASSSSDNAVLYIGGDRLEIESCHFSGYKAGAAIYFTDCEDVTIKNCVFDGNTGHELLSVDPSDAIRGAEIVGLNNLSNVIITGCSFTGDSLNPKNWAILVGDGTTTFPRSPAKSIKISDNYVKEYYRQGISLTNESGVYNEYSSGDAVISDNTVINTGWSGIKAKSIRRVRFLSNYIENFEFRGPENDSSSLVGAILNNNGAGCQAIGNYIVAGNSTAKCGIAAYSIPLTDANQTAEDFDGDESQSFTFSNNIIRDMPASDSYAFRAFDRTRQITISNNSVYRVGSFALIRGIAATSLDTDPNSISIVGGHFRGNGVSPSPGLHLIKCRNVAVSGFESHSSGGYGALFEDCLNVKLSSSSFIDSGTYNPGIYSGLRFSGATQRISVSSCRSGNENSANTTGYAVSFGGTAVSDVIVTACILTNVSSGFSYQGQGGVTNLITVNNIES